MSRTSATSSGRWRPPHGGMTLTGHPVGANPNGHPGGLNLKGMILLQPLAKVTMPTRPRCSTEFVFPAEMLEFKLTQSPAMKCFCMEQAGEIQYAFAHAGIKRDVRQYCADCAYAHICWNTCSERFCGLCIFCACPDLHSCILCICIVDNVACLQILRFADVFMH